MFGSSRPREHTGEHRSVIAAQDIRDGLIWLIWMIFFTWYISLDQAATQDAQKGDFFSILLGESSRSDKGVKVIHGTRWCGQGDHERLRVVADGFKILRGQRQFFLCQIGDSVWNACRRK